ncbi:MAG: glycine cleavage system protein H [Blastocatellia bacterium]|nr:glycine cleavage system protein H [Blastocatellia bacterium]
MSDHFIFLMGKYEARVPKDRLYAPNHMWFRAEGKVYRVGFTAFAVRLLQDVYFLDWIVEPGAVVAAKQEIGEVESSKAVSTLHAPFDGTLLSFNRELMKDPTAINVDSYGAGWLFEFDPTDAVLLTAEDYIRRLEGTWDETQRQIKGQMND